MESVRTPQPARGQSGEAASHSVSAPRRCSHTCFTTSAVGGLVGGKGTEQAAD